MLNTIVSIQLKFFLVELFTGICFLLWLSWWNIDLAAMSEWILWYPAFGWHRWGTSPWPWHDSPKFAVKNCQTLSCDRSLETCCCEHWSFQEPLSNKRMQLVDTSYWGDELHQQFAPTIGRPFNIMCVSQKYPTKIMWTHFTLVVWKRKPIATRQNPQF